MSWFRCVNSHLQRLVGIWWTRSWWSRSSRPGPGWSSCPRRSPELPPASYCSLKKTMNSKILYFCLSLVDSVVGRRFVWMTCPLWKNFETCWDLSLLFLLKHLSNWFPLQKLSTFQVLKRYRTREAVGDQQVLDELWQLHFWHPYRSVLLAWWIEQVPPA